jgi:hypothetical protein
MNRFVRTLLAAVATCSAALRAQTVPLASFELAAGWGPHSARSGDTYFHDTKGGILRIGGTLRLFAIVDRLASIARIDYNVPGMGDKISVCIIAPNGTCRRYFRDTDGFSLGLGAQMAPVSRVLVGLAAGTFRSVHNRYVAVDASYGVFSHVAALVEWRYMDLEYGSGGRVWFRPIQVGVRLH